MPQLSRLWVGTMPGYITPFVAHCLSYWQAGQLAILAAFTSSVGVLSQPINKKMSNLASLSEVYHVYARQHY